MQLHDAIVLADLGNLLAHQSIAEAPQLEAIKVADEFVDDLRPGGGRRPNSVTRELLEHVGAVPKRRHGRGVTGP